MSWADLALGDFLEIMATNVDAQLLDDYTVLNKLVLAVKALPSTQDCIANRKGFIV